MNSWTGQFFGSRRFLRWQQQQGKREAQLYSRSRFARQWQRNDRYRRKLLTGHTSYKHANDKLTITLDTPATAGELRTFRVQYHGVPANGLRIIPNKFGERTFFSENWPNRAHEWLPMIDHPYDKATSEFIITALGRH